MFELHPIPVQRLDLVLVKPLFPPTRLNQPHTNRALVDPAPRFRQRADPGVWVGLTVNLSPCQFRGIGRPRT